MLRNYILAYWNFKTAILNIYYQSPTEDGLSNIKKDCNFMKLFKVLLLVFLSISCSGKEVAELKEISVGKSVLAREVAK